MERIKQALTGIIMAGSLALPQALDYVVNGPYEVQTVGERPFYQSVIHEYEDRIIVTGWNHPWGTMLIDEGKDGIIDRAEYRSMPRVPLVMEIKPETQIFENLQKDYSEVFSLLEE